MLAIDAGRYQFMCEGIDMDGRGPSHAKKGRSRSKLALEVFVFLFLFFFSIFSPRFVPLLGCLQYSSFLLRFLFPFPLFFPFFFLFLDKYPRLVVNVPCLRYRHTSYWDLHNTDRASSTTHAH